MPISIDDIKCNNDLSLKEKELIVDHLGFADEVTSARDINPDCLGPSAAGRMRGLIEVTYKYKGVDYRTRLKTRVLVK